MASQADINTMLRDRRGVEAKIQSLINNDLKEICRGENLAVSGVKAQLQTRILRHLDDLIRNNDALGFQRIRHRCLRNGRLDGFIPPYSLDSTASISPAPAAPHRPMVPTYPRPSLPGFHGSHGSKTYPIAATRTLNFKPSPFYTQLEPITPPQDLTEMQSNRHTVYMNINLNNAVCERLRADPKLRVMVYCTAATPIASYAAVDISFPGQIEVKVNGDDVRSNFKGLKNKPGTTKPADITDLVRKAPGYNNNLQITYALTTKKYTVVVNLVHKKSAEALAEQVRQGRFISKSRVLEEMAAKASDPDIIATSTVMSLKDPISTMRLSLPCRSTVCTHNQCFDGSYFLQLQEQAPTWTCPVCNKVIGYESLNVDQYVQDILQQTSSSTEQVTIEPDGSWHPVVQGDDSAGNRGKGQARASYDNDSDDDIIEIQESTTGKVKNEPVAATPGIAQQTPPLSSREASMATPVTARPTAKRPSAVIDLTLSDDDEPPRPAKRMHTSQNTNSHYNNTLSNMTNGRGPEMTRGQSDELLSMLLENGSDALPPLQAERPNGGLQHGQRLPWPTGQLQNTAWSPGKDNTNGNHNGGYTTGPR
ncbi:hypothetical protein AAFC00_002893 [Neodothiora populina]|uniref:Uncharacterized protein n=1 Tax=Neodothiora populina TaxID=2781224 RepID=A0ABR3P8L2_9PEZI